MNHSSPAKMAAMILATAFFAATATAQEPVKIATVDLLKAFDSYWKTKLSNDQLKERGADFDKARIGMIDDLNLLREDYNRLNASIQDQANSEEKRADDQKKAQVKLAEYKRLEQQIIEFNKNAQKNPRRPDPAASQGAPRGNSGSRQRQGQGTGLRLGHRFVAGCHAASHAHRTFH